MMFDWYNVFNLTEFNESNLVSKTYEVFLEDRDLALINVFKGVNVMIVFDDVVLPVEFNEQNPYSSGGYAVFLDESNNVWLGFEL